MDYRDGSVPFKITGVFQFQDGSESRGSGGVSGAVGSTGALDSTR